MSHIIYTYYIIWKTEYWKTSKIDLRYISTYELDHENWPENSDRERRDENLSGIASARNEKILGKIINQLFGMFEI